jgi:hypothetical protein
MGTKNHGNVGVEEEELMGIILNTLWNFGINTFDPSNVVIEGIGILKPESKKLAREMRYCNTFWNNLHIPSDKSQINVGSSHLVTSRFVRNDWTIEQVITYFIKSRQLDRVRRELLDNRSDITPEEADSAIAYSLYIVAKGWMAEQQLNERSRRYVKMGETHDKGGIDFIDSSKSGEFMDENARVQLRSWRHGYDIRNGTSHDENGNKLLFWAWINGQLFTSDCWKTLCDKKRLSLTREQMAREWEVEFHKSGL